MKTSAHSIPSDVMAILGRSRAEGLNLYLPDEKLDRTMYTKVAKALELAGGKWDRRAAAHVFAGSAEDALESLLLTGTVIDLKKSLQAFYTPADVAARVVALADIRPGMLVLEPSAGHGAIAKVARQTGATVACVEINPEAVAALVAEDFAVFPRDFMTVSDQDLYERVVMNPPFTGGQDAQHVTHAFGMLLPGGRLVAVMSPSWQHRSTRWAEDFRALFNSVGGSVEDLPAGSFKSSGTSVDTVIVTLERAALAQQVAA